MSPWLTRNYEKFLMRIPLTLNFEPGTFRNRSLATSLKNPDHEKVAAPCGPAVKAALTRLDSAKLAVILNIRCLRPM
jgi:hypothetical protein